MKSFHKHPFVAGQLLLVGSLLASLCGCNKPLSSVELLERGILLAQREHFGESLDYFDRALKQEPGNPNIYYERAVAYERLEKPEMALADYGEAIRLDPEFILAFHNRSNLYASIGEYEKAIDDLSAIIQLNPGYAVAHELRSIAYEQLGNLNKAHADIDHFVELVSTPEALTRRGRLLVSLDRLDDAGRDFDAAIEANDRIAEAWLGRAIIRAQQGNAREARRDLEQAAMLDAQIVMPGIVEALEFLSKAPSEIGAGQASSAADVLSQNGWTVEPNDDEMFPFTIQQADAQQRCLCVASLNAKGDGLTMSGDQYMKVLQESRPKSLLITSVDSATPVQFVEDWQPTRDHMKSITVVVSVDQLSRKQLVSTSQVALSE